MDVTVLSRSPFFGQDARHYSQQVFFDCIVEDSQISKTKKPKMATW